MKIPHLIILLIFSNLTAYPQELVQVSGVISDAQSGEALPFATVYLRSDLKKGTVADSAGFYQLNLPKTTSELVFSFVGYKEQIRPLLIGEAQILNVKLQPISKELEGLTVKAERLIAEEFTVASISKMDIYTNPTAKADPLLAVNSLPAATTTDESANISLRGSSPTETGIFLNQVPIYDAVRFAQLNGIGTFSIFNTSIISSLQVFPSNPPLEFGNTTAGLISLQTSGYLPKKPENSLTVSLAGLGGQTQQRAGKKGAITIFGNYQFAKLLKALNMQALESIENFHSADLGIHYVRQLGKKSTLKIFNYSLSESYNFNFEHPSAHFTFQQARKRNFTIANFRTISPHGEFSVNHGNSFSLLKLNGGNLEMENAQKDLFFSLNYQHFFKQFHFKTGLSLDRRQSDIDGQFPAFDYALAPNHPTLRKQFVQKMSVAEAYLYGKYTFSSDWALGIGLRKNLPLDNQESYWSSQVNLNYQPTTSSKLNFSLGNYHKYNLADGNSDAPYLIASQQISLDYELNTKYFGLTTAIFHKQTAIASINSRINGLEMAINGKIQQKLDASLSFTYLDVAQSEENMTYSGNYDLDYFVKGMLQYKPQHTWSFGLSWLWRQGTHYQPLLNSAFSSDLGVFQPIYVSINQQNRLPDYSTLDLNISKMVGLSENCNLVLFASLSNTFNRENIRQISYDSTYSIPQPALFSQRTFFFGGMLSF